MWWINVTKYSRRQGEGGGRTGKTLNHRDILSLRHNTPIWIQDIRQAVKYFAQSPSPPPSGHKVEGKQTSIPSKPPPHCHLTTRLRLSRPVLPHNPTPLPSDCKVEGKQTSSPSQPPPHCHLTTRLRLSRPVLPQNHYPFNIWLQGWG